MNIFRVIFLTMLTGESFLSQPMSAMANECNVNHYKFVIGVPTEANMQVYRGGTCLFHMVIPTSGVGNAGIISATPTVRPANGILGSRSIRLFAYQPNPGYVGADHFEIRVRYDRDNGDGPQETTLIMTVSVN